MKRLTEIEARGLYPLTRKDNLCYNCHEKTSELIGDAHFNDEAGHGGLIVWCKNCGCHVIVGYDGYYEEYYACLFTTEKKQNA